MQVTVGPYHAPTHFAKANSDEVTARTRGTCQAWTRGRPDRNQGRMFWLQGPAEVVELGYRVAHEIMQREMAARGVPQPPPGTAKVMPWPKAQPKPAAAGAPPKEAAPKPAAAPKQPAPKKRPAPKQPAPKQPAPKPPPKQPAPKQPAPKQPAPPGLEHVVSTNSDDPSVRPQTGFSR